MADTPGIFDNGLSTARTIQYSKFTQVFQGDASYSIDATDTQDYFKLTLNRSSGLVLSLNPQSGNLDFQLLDSGGGELAASTNLGNIADALVLDNLAAGTYFIRVHNDADNSVSSSYSLRVDTIAPEVELLWRNYSVFDGSQGIWFMDGTTRTGTATAGIAVADPSWIIEGTGDFNGDGNEDWVWRNYATGQNAVWFMNASNQRTGFAYLPAIYDANWKLAGVADFTGDGQNDLVWRNQATGQNVVWHMQGTSFVTWSSLLSVADSNWWIQTAKDFDGNGTADLIWRNFATGENAVWYMNGTTRESFGFFLTNSGEVGWNITGIADFNNDGKNDLVWRNSVDGRNAVWYMDGQTRLGFASLTSVTDPNWRMEDVITTSRTADLAGNSLSAAFNVGTLTNTAAYTERLGSITEGDVDDYYRFTLSTTTTFTAALAGLTSEVDLQLISDANDNGVIDSGETLDFAANASGETELQLNRALSSGTYFVRVRSLEPLPTDYSLTFSAITSQFLDLVVTRFSADDRKTLSASNPTNFNIRYELKNTSTDESVDNVSVNFYISRDATITTGDKLLGTDVVSLGPNGSTGYKQVQLQLPLANDLWWASDQTYYIGIIADPNNQVPEPNEVNNIAQESMQIRGILRPDLRGAGFNLASGSNYSPGDALRITGSIQNIGNIESASRVTVWFFISQDQVFGDLNDTNLAAFIDLPVINDNESVNFDTNTAPVNPGDVTPSTAPFLTDTPPLLLPGLDDPVWKDQTNPDEFYSGPFYLGMYIDYAFNFAGEGEGGILNNSGVGLGIDYAQINVSFS